MKAHRQQINKLIYSLTLTLGVAACGSSSSGEPPSKVPAPPSTTAKKPAPTGSLTRPLTPETPPQAVPVGLKEEIVSLAEACNLWRTRYGVRNVSYSFVDAMGNRESQTITLSSEGEVCGATKTQASFAVTRKKGLVDTTYLIYLQRSATTPWKLAFTQSNCVELTTPAMSEAYSREMLVSDSFLIQVDEAVRTSICPAQERAVTADVLKILNGG